MKDVAPGVPDCADHAAELASSGGRREEPRLALPVPEARLARPEARRPAVAAGFREGGSESRRRG